MKAARVVIVAVLLPLAITGALVLSASATIDLFSSQGVTVAWAAVGMLEVTSLAGTLLWVLVGNRRLRRDAILVTCGATAVALVAGVFAYGPVGAVAGVLLVALTHLASLAWREPWDEPDTEPLTQARTAAEGQSQRLPADPVETVEPPRTVADAVADTTPEEWSHEAAVAWAARENAGAKRVMAHTGLSEYRAKKAAAEAKATRALRVAR